MKGSGVGSTGQAYIVTGGRRMTPSKRSYPFGLGDSERFWSKVNKTESCWIWTSATLPNGYGVFRLGSAHYAHRISFFQFNGCLTPGMVVDHICRTRNCVNPSHLREVTRGDNVRLGMLFRPFSTHCYRGHQMDEENTYIFYQRGGAPMRQCRKCRLIRNQAYRVRKRGDAINEVLEMHRQQERDKQ